MEEIKTREALQKEKLQLMDEVKLRSNLEKNSNELAKAKEKSDKEKFELLEELQLLKMGIESSEIEVENKSKEIFRLQKQFEEIRQDKLR